MSGRQGSGVDRCTRWTVEVPGGGHDGDDRQSAGHAVGTASAPGGCEAPEPEREGDEGRQRHGRAGATGAGMWQPGVRVSPGVPVGKPADDDGDGNGEEPAAHDPPDLHRAVNRSRSAAHAAQRALDLRAHARAGRESAAVARGGRPALLRSSWANSSALPSRAASATSPSPATSARWLSMSSSSSSRSSGGRSASSSRTRARNASPSGVRAIAVIRAPPCAGPAGRRSPARMCASGRSTPRATHGRGR